MRASLGIFLLVALLPGCDTKATASDPAGGAAAKPEQKSREYESCGTSMHCAENLRCFDNVCRRQARSAVGDYHAAAGATARERRDLDAAIVSYAQALGQYAAEKIEVPPDIDCQYGATLALARAKRENAELGAKVLHRCVLAVPVGSPLRDVAMAHLALLAEVGLDPLMIGGAKLADVYLTKAPQRPSSDKLTVAVSANPATGSKSYGLLSSKLLEPELKGPLVACWDSYHTASKKDALAVTLPVKVAFYREFEDDDEDPGRWITKIDAATGLSGPEAAADACVRQVVEPALKGLKLVDGFNTKVTITIK